MQFWSSLGILVTFGLALDSSRIVRASDHLAPSGQSSSIQARLLDRCCQVGREKTLENSKFNCKLSAREALLNTDTQTNYPKLTRNGNNLLALSAESLLAREPSFGDQCEMVLESCCLALHRTRNCDSGKQFAKSGTSCMDVELSKEATLATESFNDCCMSCSLGILAAKNSPQNDTLRAAGDKCRLISPLASSMSGQLYEQTYTECCQENLLRPSGALFEPGTPIDCNQANPCAQRCLPAGSPDPTTRKAIDQDRCDCFTGFRLGPDGVSCLDIDECSSNTHTCNRDTEICDNTRGSFRCLARSSQTERQQQQQQNVAQHHHHHQHHHFATYHQHRSQHQSKFYQKPAGRAVVLDGRTLDEGKQEPSLNTEPQEQPFASLRLRPPNPSRW